MAIHVVTCGGTIASWIDGRSARLLAGHEVLESVRESDDLRLHDLGGGPSWDLTLTDLAAIATYAVACANKPGSDGVVVTLGTDTLELTAFLADLLLGPGTRPAVAFTGSMRFGSDTSADGPGNIEDAVAVVKSGELAGSLVVFGGSVFASREATKVDATAIQPFDAPMGPVGSIPPGGAFHVLRSPDRSHYPNPPLRAETDVVVLKVFPGMTPTLLEAALDMGARGVIIEGTPSMSVPSALLPAIRRTTSEDIPVVVTSPCRVLGTQRHVRSGTTTLAARGAIPAGGLPTTKALAALMVAMAVEPTVAGARRWFDAFHSRRVLP